VVQADPLLIYNLAAMPLASIITPAYVLEEADRILDESSGESGISERIALVSARFVGRPYAERPLDPGAASRPAETEALRIRFDAFDCVTYIETVLALAFSRSAQEFVEKLRLIRYESGVVEWRRRNHYMVDWCRNNIAAGFISDATSGPLSVGKERRLDVVQGLGSRTVSFRCFPKQAVGAVSGAVESGELVFFVATRKNLDVFHTGFLFPQAAGIILRHATRTKGAVVEQDLSGFLKNNKTSGLILCKPAIKRIESEAQ
jgi:hypothetical protein